MSSWLSRGNKDAKPNPVLTIKHNAGFFSCCSVRLHKIVEYFNRFKTLPETVDSSQQFEWYKPADRLDESITDTYFLESNLNIPFRKRIEYEHYFQYVDYKAIKYNTLMPFISKYFSPSIQIRGLIGELESKYNLTDYNNIAVLFYRGNDKATEIALPTYSDYVTRARALLAANPLLRFLVQSDESEFIELMLAEFPGRAFYFKDETRNIKKSETTVDKVFKESNYHFSKHYLAITIIMSKCKYIICGTGNCSIWIALYRGNANGIQQFLKTSWV
jgi:hypothetical protein